MSRVVFPSWCCGEPCTRRAFLCVSFCRLVGRSRSRGFADGSAPYLTTRHRAGGRRETRDRSDHGEPPRVQSVYQRLEAGGDIRPRPAVRWGAEPFTRGPAEADELPMQPRPDSWKTAAVVRCPLPASAMGRRSYACQCRIANRKRRRRVDGMERAVRWGVVTARRPPERERRRLLKPARLPSVARWSAGGDHMLHRTPAETGLSRRRRSPTPSPAAPASRAIYPPARSSSVISGPRTVR